MNHQNPGETHYSAKKTGETEIFNIPEEYKHRKKNDTDGEYIDYKDV